MKKNDNLKTIKADLYRYFGDTSVIYFFKGFFKSAGFKYTYFLRKCSFHKRNGHRLRFLFFRCLLERYRFKYGFDIPYVCKIGRGLYLGHFGGVVISSMAVIGSNVNIAQGVTIGRSNRGKKKGAPVIGNKVWIGAHAIVVGGIKIGDNSLIGPGAYVNIDIPENAVVIGNPAKIISFKGSEGYINRTVSDYAL